MSYSNDDFIISDDDILVCETESESETETEAKEHGPSRKRKNCGPSQEAKKKKRTAEEEEDAAAMDAFLEDKELSQQKKNKTKKSRKKKAAENNEGYDDEEDDEDRLFEMYASYIKKRMAMTTTENYLVVRVDNFTQIDQFLQMIAKMSDSVEFKIEAGDGTAAFVTSSTDKTNTTFYTSKFVYPLVLTATNGNKAKTEIESMRVALTSFHNNIKSLDISQHLFIVVSETRCSSFFFNKNTGCVDCIRIPLMQPICAPAFGFSEQTTVQYCLAMSQGHFMKTVAHFMKNNTSKFGISVFHDEDRSSNNYLLFESVFTTSGENALEIEKFYSLKDVSLYSSSDDNNGDCDCDLDAAVAYLEKHKHAASNTDIFDVSGMRVIHLEDDSSGGNKKQKRSFLSDVATMMPDFHSMKEKKVFSESYSLDMLNNLAKKIGEGKKIYLFLCKDFPLIVYFPLIDDNDYLIFFLGSCESE